MSWMDNEMENGLRIGVVKSMIHEPFESITFFFLCILPNSFLANKWPHTKFHLRTPVFCLWLLSKIHQLTIQYVSLINWLLPRSLLETKSISYIPDPICLHHLHSPVLSKIHVWSNSVLFQILRRCSFDPYFILIF